MAPAVVCAVVAGQWGGFTARLARAIGAVGRCHDGEEAEARSTASRWIEFGRAAPIWSGEKPGRLLAGFSTRVTIRKPAPPETFTLRSEAF